MVKSPCISVCKINRDGFCKGCFRTNEEIAYWTNLSKDAKIEVLERLELRKIRSKIEKENN